MIGKQRAPRLGFPARDAATARRLPPSCLPCRDIGQEHAAGQQAREWVRMETRREAQADAIWSFLLTAG